MSGKNQEFVSIKKDTKGGLRRIDPWTTIVPLIAIAVLCVFFVTMPESSTETLNNVRSFLGDSFGSYYLIIGLGVLIVSLWISFSRISPALTSIWGTL